MMFLLEFFCCYSNRYHRLTRADTVLTGRNAPVLRQNPWQYGKVFPAGLSLSGHISAPAKLPAPDSDGCSSDFWLLSSRWADARQDEKGKKRRKDTLSGVRALVN